MTVERLIKIIEEMHNGHWEFLFRDRGDGTYLFYPTGHILTGPAHLAVVRFFTDREKSPVLHGVAPVVASDDAPDDAENAFDGAHLTAEQRRINSLRARAVESTESRGRGRGR